MTKLSFAAMRAPPVTVPLSWVCLPLELAARWPADHPLTLLHSGRFDPRWARWSMLASPTVRYQFVDGRSRWIGSPPRALQRVHFIDDAMKDLNAVIDATRIDAPGDAGEIPFDGGWIGYFSYDLGRWIEPQAQTAGGGSEDRHWPLIDLAWCPHAVVYDHRSGAWHAVGAAPEFNGCESDRLHEPAEFSLGALQSCAAPSTYLAQVARAKDYIAGGDIFQANITRRFSAAFAGSTRAFGINALKASRAWFGAYLECGDVASDGGQRSEIRGQKSEASGQWLTAQAAGGDSNRCIVSMSPELFLEVDPITRRVTTRPIKGTRPSETDSQSLIDSVKDTAELHMIVDLMRNDLGRVCEFNTVRVPHQRLIETHPTVHHGVGEVTGTLRGDVSFADLLRATFPGGSVTGAPKIRAMQIIDELEPVRRGPYCGAIGFISDRGGACLNIAIRTALVTGRRDSHQPDHFVGTLDYSAGSGIVADSDPAAEYQEMLDKTAVLRMIEGNAARTPALLAR